MKTTPAGFQPCKQRGRIARWLVFIAVIVATLLPDFEAVAGPSTSGEPATLQPINTVCRLSAARRRIRRHRHHRIRHRRHRRRHGRPHRRLTALELPALAVRAARV